MTMHSRSAAFEDVLEDVTSGNAKTLQSDYQPVGRYPVVDQGQSLIAGYLDDETALCRADLPVIIFGDHTKAFKFVDFPFCIGADGTKVLRPKVDADPKYLFHYLRSLKIPDAGYSRHYKFLKRFEIPLPPVVEQRRIAAILDAADALRQKRRQALRLLDQLTQAIFVEMFGDPGSNSMAWPTTSLDDLTEAADRINYGVVQPGEDVEDGVPLVRVADLMRGEVRSHGLKRILPSIESSYSRSRLKGDEILIACVGSIGAVALATPEVVGANIARAVARVRVDKQKALRRFVAEQLRTGAIQRYFQSEIRVVAQPTLNIKQIKETPMIVPPLRYQERYCERIVVVDEMIAAARSSLAALDRLFASLQHRAFRGEL